MIVVEWLWLGGWVFVAGCLWLGVCGWEDILALVVFVVEWLSGSG